MRGEEQDGLLPSLRQSSGGEEGCLAVIRSWDVTWDDIKLLARGRLRDFRLRYSLESHDFGQFDELMQAHGGRKISMAMT
jgi:hypothetical protein